MNPCSSSGVIGHGRRNSRWGSSLTSSHAVGTYLFQRVLRDGHDSRFDEIKKSAPKFFVAWMAQATWCSLICLPVIALNAVPASAFAAIPGVRITDVLGVALWVGGITFEATADKQKSQWLKEKREKKHHEDFMTRGLWQKRYAKSAVAASPFCCCRAGVLMFDVIANIPTTSASRLSGPVSRRLRRVSSPVSPSRRPLGSVEAPAVFLVPCRWPTSARCSQPSWLPK